VGTAAVERKAGGSRGGEEGIREFFLIYGDWRGAEVANRIDSLLDIGSTNKGVRVEPRMDV
jgi:hypothetical protein